MQPLVSVTMATYNVEEYIYASLQCIIQQSLENIEVICIDDGSTDKTVSILKECAANDERIKVISKVKNEGLSMARNAGLEIAKGKYICFVDGDDLMDINLFEKAYQLAELNNSDLVIWDFVTFWNTNEIEEKKQKPSSLISNSKEDTKALLKQPAFTWLKLIKTDVARSLGISFPNGLTKQDIPVHWHLLTKISDIAILPERLSYYRQQPKATSYKTDAHLFDIATILDITEAFLKKNNLFENYKDVFLKQQLSLLSAMYDFVDEPLKSEAMLKIKQRLGNEQLGYIASNKPLLWQTRIFYKTIQGSLKAKLKFKIWLFMRSSYRYLKGSLASILKKNKV
tara:strand:- start:11293 stop:12315 length:1023 start_codon:yes stop_codon:yes gene_type:complete